MKIINLLLPALLSRLGAMPDRRQSGALAGAVPATRPEIKVVFAALTLLMVAGCAGVSPGRLTVDRLDYGQVIADSWKRQTLLNVVRLRYADAPVFLEVASVINSHSVGGKVSGSAQIPEHVNPNVIQLGGEGTWSNTPTVTYQPLAGERFTRSLLQPVPPAAVFQLLQGGWPADLVLGTVVRSINDLRNASDGTDGDPGFLQLLEALSRIQRADGLGVRVETRMNGSAVVVMLRRGDGDSRLQEDARRALKLLGLDQSVSDFEIAYGLIPKRAGEVAILSRSMLELMLRLGLGVELPAMHRTEGRALRGRAGDSQASTLVRIRSGTEEPPDAYAAVTYKGYWYWIDDTDISSKRVFTFLLILSSLAETGQGAVAPIVTVPSR